MQSNQPTARIWPLMLFSYLGMMALAIAINFLPVFLTTMSTDLGGSTGLSDGQLGLIGSMTFVGLVCGIVLTGPLADRIGARIFAVGGNALIAVGLAMLHRASSYEWVMASAFVMGFGAGSLDMILSPVVSAIQSSKRTLSLNLLHGFYCIGAVVTILVSTVALKNGIGWREVSLGLLPLPLFIGVAFCVVRLPQLIHESTTRIRMRKLILKPVFIALMIAICLGGATEAGMAYWLPAYAEKTLGFSRFASGMGLVGFSIAMVVGRMGILLLPARINTVTLMLVCSVATAILFPIASFAGSKEIAMAACVLAGLTGSCLWPSTLAVAADRYPNGGATMFGILAAMGNLGGIVMPWIVGTVADATTMRWGLATATLCPVAMVVLLVWLGRRNKMMGDE